MVIPDHQLIRLIARGSYGEVWLAKSSLGPFRAVKIVFESTFRDKRPFDRELGGVQRFEPVSRLHQNLMDVLQVGRNEAAGFFYYIMEVADDVTLGQAIQPAQYFPRTLAHEIAGHRHLPIDTCVRIGIAIASALSFLHNRGLVHRDVKPSNIVFVDGVPKLADIGLVVEMAEAKSYVGTDGFIPPEGPGTAQADIYSLGKVLYEISTGKDRHDYPELPTLLDEPTYEQELLTLNRVLLKACRAEPRQRYKSAVEMEADLATLTRGETQLMSREVLQLRGAGLMFALLLVGLLSLVVLFERFRTDGRWALSPPGLLHANTSAAGLVGLWRGEEEGLNSLHRALRPVANRVTFVPSPAGRAFRFDANKSFLEIPDASFLRLTNELTIEFWLKREQFTNADFVVEKGGDWTREDLNYSVAVNDQRSGNCLMFGFACGCRMGGFIADFNWHHCAIVARNGERDPGFYIDGAEQAVSIRRGDATIHLAPSTRPLHIGAQIDPEGEYNYFSPKLINNLAVYNRALSPAEIQLDASGRHDRSDLDPAKTTIRSNVPGNLGVGAVEAVLMPSGLISWWRGEGDANDSVGRNHGVLIGDASFAAGKVGGGFLLSGAGSYIRIPHSPSLNLSGEFTIELWFKNQSTIPYVGGLIAKRGSESGPINFDLSLNGRGISVLYNDPLASGGEDPLSTFEVSIVACWPEPMVWHHLAASFRQVGTNAVELKTFLDGELVKTAALPGCLARSVNQYPVTIGADAEYPTFNYFEGVLDEISLYNRALSEVEIRQIFTAGSAGKHLKADKTP